MTKSVIMKTAWAMYKAAGCTTRYEFSLALKAAWAQAKAPQLKKTVADRLIDLGGNLWERDNMRRIYLNRDTVLAIIGLEVTFYKTGNVSNAALNGEPLSNGRASRYVNDFIYGKVWFDLNDGKFYTKNTKTITAVMIENAFGC